MLKSERLLLRFVRPGPGARHAANSTQRVMPGASQISSTVTYYNIVIGLEADKVSQCIPRAVAPPALIGFRGEGLLNYMGRTRPG